VRVCWAGNRCIKERGQVSELQLAVGMKEQRKQKEAGTSGWRLMSAWRGYILLYIYYLTANGF
jgi:hypothetical protein